MPYDLLIRGGVIIDPASGLQSISDLAISSGRIAAIAHDLPATDAALVVDAHGQYVTPGLIDMHTHCYWGATYWGIEADPVAARTGVTTWVDAGSAGAYSFPGFRRYAVEANRARLFAFLHISAIGLIARTYESSNLDYCDIDVATTVVDANRDVIIGIKVRMDRDSTRGTGLEPLRRARQLAERTQLPLMVHIAIAPPLLNEIVALLRPGDILTHCCTGQTNRLIDEQGHVHSYIHQAREQGVILDLGHGTGSFRYTSLEAMQAENILPDVLSSDIHQQSVLGPMYDLPITLSKFLNSGMSLPDVIARATIRPAAAIGRPELGTLRVGAPADVAIFHLEAGDFTFYDSVMEPRRGTQRLVNTATYIAGQLVPRAPERPPHSWVTADFPAEQRSLLPGIH